MGLFFFINHIIRLYKTVQSKTYKRMCKNRFFADGLFPNCWEWIE